MDPYGIAAIIGALALLVVGVLGGAAWFYVAGRDSKAEVAAEVERRHVAEQALLDATIASLRSELALVREKARDGAAAADGQLAEADRVSRTPPGSDGDRLLWGGAGGDSPAGGRPSEPPASVPG